MTFVEGEEVWALNLKYKDGTRLRGSPNDDSDFNGVWVGNDTTVRVVRSENHYVLVQKSDDTNGWIRERNLTREARKTGITKGVVSNQIVTPDPEYCMGTKIYGVGIKQDPIPGEKMGKGIQHLTSAYWVTDMAQLIGANFATMQEFLRHAKRGSEQHPGYDYLYLINLANYLFNKADVAGLKNQESKDFFLMATWLVMAASEVDKFPFGKYTAEEREQQRLQFYDIYLNPKPGPGVVQVGREDANLLGKFASPICRVDLLPMIAMDRLGVNNELSALKYKDAEQPLREGFLLSKRTDSLKRHFEAVHRGLQDEDHIIHLLWNFMAIYHVNHVFPNQNDLINFENIRLQSESKPLQSYSPATSLQKIIENRFEPSQVLKLDWNEGVIPPPVSVRTAMVEFIAKADGHYLKWYPNLGGGEDLRNKLAEYTGAIPENILVTNGSDDALILICQTFLGEGKVAVAPMPTYEHFCVNAENSGATLIRLELEDFLTSSPDEIAAAVEKHHPSVVYLISPNNPTGAHWDIPAVSNLATRYPDVIFICDEAYHEFARIDPKTGKPVTCVSLVQDLQNVIITRTFSKAFCLASLRVGYVVTHPNTVERLRIRYNPKSVNSLAQVAAYQALVEFESYYKPYITVTNNARENFVKDLQQGGFIVKSGGGGNFVCVGIPQSKISQVTKKLEEKSIFVRDISARVPGFIRISIGEDMSRVRDALLSLIGELNLF